MAISVTVAGVNRTSKITDFRISRRLGERSTAEFSTADKSVTWLPSQGQEIIVTDGATKLFGGIIDKIDYLTPVGTEDSATCLLGRLHCSDYTQYLDRHRVAAVWESKTPSEMLAELLIVPDGNSAIWQDGITANSVDTFSSIGRLVLSYCTATEAVDQIAMLAGPSARWWVDFNKDIHLTESAVVDAPFNITSHSVDVLSDSLSRTDDTSQYANKVIIKCNASVAPSVTEEFIGLDQDGNGLVEERSFYVANPIGSIVSITLTDTLASPETVTDQEVGVYGVDTGKKWYWLEGTQEISQEPSDDPIRVSDTLTVTYVPLWSNVVIASDEDEISERALIEGGTGVHAILIDDSDSTTLAQVQAKVAAELAKRKLIPVYVRYSTRTYIEPGQIQTITLAVHGLDDDFLVQSVDSYWDGEDIRYDVETVLGASRPDWVKSLAGALGGTSGGNAAGMAGIADVEVIAYPI